MTFVMPNLLQHSSYCREFPTLELALYQEYGNPMSVAPLMISIEMDRAV